MNCSAYAQASQRIHRRRFSTPATLDPKLPRRIPQPPDTCGLVHTFTPHSSPAVAPIAPKASMHTATPASRAEISQHALRRSSHHVPRLPTLSRRRTVDLQLTQEDKAVGLSLEGELMHVREEQTHMRHTAGIQPVQLEDLPRIVFELRLA
jgi:hypothetical protein